MATLLAACDTGSDTTTNPPPAPASLAGVYSGTFPCDGCPGIPTTVWIRDDGSYFIEQAYPGQSAPAGAVASLGRWVWFPDADTVELRGEGPPRRFLVTDSDTLVMQTPSPLEHRVDRDRTRGPFDRLIVLEGWLEPGRDNATFTECLTGMQLPVDRDGDYASFARQYRRAQAAGAPAFVEFEGRFRWQGDGSARSIRIVRFVSIRPEGRC